jgi:hypothetical protein
MMSMAANNALDAQTVRADQIRTASAGVQRFMKAARRAGQDDPLDGPQWVIPGILLEGQTAMCPGPPGSGKSFAILDWLARVACGLDFNGKPVTQGGTIYVTGEGQAGLAQRIAALASEFELNDASPFIYVRTMPRLLDPQEVKDFISAMKLQTADWSSPCRLMAFDTFNRAIVGGSENEGKDVAKLLDADSQIKEAFGCATIFAHHPGKAEGNDTRGHSSLRGDTDVTAIFSGKTGTRTIEIKKQKDAEDGQIFAYTLRQVHLGVHNTSGDPVTSCLVDWLDNHAAKTAKGSSKGWPKGLTTLYDVLTTASIETGFDHRSNGDGPMVRAVPIEDVRALHRKRYIGSGDGDRQEAERKAFGRNLRTAKDARLLSGEVLNGKELIWAVR